MTPEQAAARAAYDAAAAEFARARAMCAALGYDATDEDDRVNLDHTTEGGDALDLYTIAVDDCETARIAWLRSCEKTS